MDIVSTYYLVANMTFFMRQRTVGEVSVSTHESASDDHAESIGYYLRVGFEIQIQANFTSP